VRGEVTDELRRRIADGVSTYVACAAVHRRELAERSGPGPRSRR
jgi:hypothetical protein